MNDKIIRILESPSKIKKLDRCEMFMQLTYKERWEQKVGNRSLPARLAGNAFAKACQIIHTEFMNPLSMGPKQDPLQAAITLFDKQWEYCLSKGIEFPIDKDGIIRTELRRVIPRYMKETPLRGWKITHVEFHIKEYGCRVDVAGIDLEGNYAIGEVKYKSTLRDEYRNSTIEEFGQDQQFHQYYSVWQRVFPNDLPLYIYLILVSGSPWRIDMPRFSYNSRFIERWYLDTKSKSDRIKMIESGELEPEISATHRDQYGWCAMKRACLELGFDRELMKHEYVQLDELPE